MKASFFELKSSSDNISLSVMSVVPDSPEKAVAVLQLVHGMCEHKERYMPFMEYMAEKGYVCVIHDHRGHGASVKDENDLGYFYEGGHQAMIEDIHLVTSWIKDAYHDLPVILFGHSMGSMAVRCYAKRYDDEIFGLVVCGSPSYNPAAPLGKVLSGIASMVLGVKYRPGFINRMAFGNFNRRFGKVSSPNAWICSDPEIVAEYDRDPLCGFCFTANGFKTLFSIMSDAYDRKGWKMGNMGLYVLFVSGEEDPCLVNEDKFHKSVRFMYELGYKYVKEILYPGMRHEILNEKGKEKVWNDIFSFCNYILNTVK